MLYYYLFVAVFILLMGYVLYQQIASAGWDESEIRELEHLELNVAGIARLLDAPDVRFLLGNRKSRENLFMEFSDALKRDVITLYRLGGIRATSVGLLVVFFVSYYLMRAKAGLLCGRRDLHFLSALEMALVRSMKS
jgi:hypothetical protein